MDGCPAAPTMVELAVFGRMSEQQAGHWVLLAWLCLYPWL